ncbi:MAG: sodium:proton antiporter [Desulfamplus sp.]|nr:sodium:proton antiporter [Desulfamplus sp.]MBF0243345.1 sodium:proton antiporter [Desulfamplus sp.]MBF0390399.1 sodium:proton antiporter [Desulfamplus sp.]
MKILGTITILLCGGLLIFFTSDFPDFGDPKSPASIHLSPYFIEHTLEDTAVPNIVTSVLADYRSYDTMFETTVILTAGLACFLLLRIPTKEVTRRYYLHEPTGVTLRFDGDRYPKGSNVFKRIDSNWVPYDIIINFTCRLLIHFIQIFALYVVAHGHYSPGGGFQGGVVIGASIILFAISSNLRASIKRLGEKAAAIFTATGVFIYAGTGALCMVIGEHFLNYSFLAPLLGTDRIMARSHGIFIVEIGVAVAVMAVMIWIYYNLSSAGKQDEGL